MHTAPFALITVDDVQAARDALAKLGLLEADEEIESMERAGEGNMNMVIRITTNRRRVILKQSRPWVEKYPQIAAPADRILAEIGFYRRIEPVDAIRNRVPKLIGFDAEMRLMVLDDLGKASDYSDLYERREPESLPLSDAIAWLAKLHSIEVDRSERSSLGNRELLELNHAHIFVIPLQFPAAIPLDSICPGLEQLACDVRETAGVAKAAEVLGARYLGLGNYLLHGDFYPGSWLRTPGGLRIIDPEFTFAGPVEFDLGVLAAHRVLIGGNDDSADVVADLYRQAGGAKIEPSLMLGFAAMEIIRRLIGVAQLPLVATFEQRLAMMTIALAWIRGRF